jgi:hypothetical protein
LGRGRKTGSTDLRNSDCDESGLAATVQRGG